MKIVDVALATAAAPIYFPLARNDRGVFADGGLVGKPCGLVRTVIETDGIASLAAPKTPQ